MEINVDRELGLLPRLDINVRGPDGASGRTYCVVVL